MCQLILTKSYCINGCLLRLFQSTLPQGKWLIIFTRLDRWFGFQSTLPQGKWPGPSIALPYSRSISIHTSTREVTCFGCMACMKPLFQSTLPQGKWRWHRVYSPTRQDFNPHFHKGSDSASPFLSALFCIFQSTLPQGKWRWQWTVVRATLLISIHTSTREVTQITWPPGIRGENFNPHFHKGSDKSHTYIKVSFTRFQSTLPQGKWLNLRYRFDYCKTISIHTSTREVTPHHYSLFLLRAISIHTSTREVT